MKFIYSDLLNLLKEKPGKELLSERLFQLGHEHTVNGDIFDMELTPNRGDCISLVGLARDLNIFFGNEKSLKIFDGEIPSLNIDFQNLSPLDCPKISFLEIEIQKTVYEYKDYLENYFSVLGNKKTNFFTDVSNYISYEQGQPTHCFDADEIDGKLTFESKSCDESFETLLDSNIKLKSKNCVFSLNNKIISLAGVMGGMSTCCKQNTQKALVECAFFNPEAIIGKTSQYNLTSDAAHKFERGVDLFCHERVLRRFIEVVKDHALIKSIKIQSFDEITSHPKKLPINIKKINKILGTQLQKDEYLYYLSKLGFTIEDEITIPSFRHDISTQNDLAEEIARVIGYNNIESSSFKIKEKPNQNNLRIKKIKNLLIKNGFSEVINFPFESKDDMQSIKIDNPLDSNRSFMRTSLKHSLLENLLYNERRQKDSIKLFEISDIYSKNSQINQEKKLGIIISGRKGHNHTNFTQKLDEKYLKDVLCPDNKNTHLIIEELSRSNLKTKIKEKIFYLEIPINDLNESIFEGISLSKEQINFIKYKSVSEYPSSSRDFSFSIVNVSDYNKFISYFSDLKMKNLKDSFIFDFYKNEKNSEIKVGVRLIFQSTLSTLSDEEIQRDVDKILKPIIDLKGVSIPGL